MIKISTLIAVLGVMLLSAAVFATSADATGIVWRAVNKTGSSLFDIANVAFTNCSNGNVLQYQTSNSTWICAAPSGVTSINSQTGSSQTLTGTANTQTITKGLTINSGTLGGSLNANSQRITSVGTPTSSTDADVANRMGLLGNKVTSACSDGYILQYQSSNSTWICSFDPKNGVLSGNLTTTSTAAFTTIFAVPLTANSGNVVQGTLIAETNTAGAAVQGAAHLSAATQTGFCLWETPTTATANTVDYLVLSTTASGTGETVWLPAANVPGVIKFTCVTKGSGTPNLIVEFK
ncbi:MAG: hypothetical protein EB154_09940, partial [Nitrosopumilaceae archaeon]|nr:hypothetical protein [Nitrosopumilaceae archaeon]